MRVIRMNISIHRNIHRFVAENDRQCLDVKPILNAIGGESVPQLMIVMIFRIDPGKNPFVAVLIGAWFHKLFTS